MTPKTEAASLGEQIKTLTMHLGGCSVGGIPSGAVPTDEYVAGLVDRLVAIATSEPPAPQAEKLDGWRIDHSAGRPILVYKDCSVIEAEQAYYVLHLLKSVPQAEPVHWRALLAADEVPMQLNPSLHVVGFRTFKAADAWVASKTDFDGWKYTIEPLYNRPQAVGESLPLTGWPMKGVRVEGDTVVISVKGGNDAARWLCGELVANIKALKEPT